MKKKILALVLAMVLLVVGVAAGTLAWLTSKSDTVTNTFTTSNIKVKLEETKNDFKMVPGFTIDKDPKITVLAGSEECFLFVKLDESSNFGTYLEYAVADGWERLEKDKDGKDITDLIYFRKVLTENIGTAYSVLKGDQVAVKSSVTKEQMNALDAENAAKPTLTITAYASQLYKSAGMEFTAAEAWDNVKP